MNFTAATTIKVPNQGPPPSDFIAALFHFGAIAPDYIFAQNPNKDDIMGTVQPVLAPAGWTGLAQRRAGLLVALLYDAGFESSWVWTTGVDMEAGAGTGRPPSTWEAGAWQVSQNSIKYDPSLLGIVGAHCGGATDPASFQAQMKADKLFAIQYAAQLFRCNTQWSGPCVGGHLVTAMTGTDNGATAIAAMNELMVLLPA